MTVTSGLAVAVGLGLGASTHLVTLTPLAAAVVVQKEPCAKAPDAGPRTVIKDNEVNSISLFTNPLSLCRQLWTPNLNELGTRINTNLDHRSHSFRSTPSEVGLLGSVNVHGLGSGSTPGWRIGHKLRTYACR